MLRARRSFLLATEERHGTHYRRTEFAIRLVLCAPLTLVDTRRPTHPPLPSTTLCVEHHLIDLSLYCVLYSCVRNDAPVCLCFSSWGLLLSRNWERAPRAENPLLLADISWWPPGQGMRATLSLLVSSACVRRVVVVYFLRLCVKRARFGWRLRCNYIYLLLLCHELIQNQYFCVLISYFFFI